MKKYIWPIRILALVLFAFLLTRGKMMLWLIIYAVSVIVALLAGRFYCGYLCPMNTVMTFAERLSVALGLQRKKTPRIFKSEILPWVFLLVSVLSMFAARRFLQKNIPILLIWLAISFLLTLFLKPEVFHVFICPFSTLLKLTGKQAKYSERVNAEACIGCRKCVKECPGLAITMTDSDKARINRSYCLQCKRCEQVCPTDAIDYSGAR